MRYKKVTDKQVTYIFNNVISPRIEYRSQLQLKLPAEISEFRHVEMSKLVSTFRHCHFEMPKCRNNFDMSNCRNSKNRFFRNISASRDRIRTKQPPFDSSRRGGSNKPCFIFLRSPDVEIFNETSINRHF
jgi:hypothetical protein